METSSRPAAAKKIAVAASVCLCASLALATACSGADSDRDLRLRGAYAHVGLGMHVKDVEGHLGNPSIRDGNPENETSSWYGDRLIVTVVYDSEGKVADSIIIADEDLVPEDPPPVARFLRYLRSLVRRAP